MVDAVQKSSRRTRLAVAVLVAAIHLLVLLALIRAFAPQIGNAVLRPVTDAFNVTVTTAPPPPPSAPAPRPTQRENEGAAAPAGKKAVPRQATAPVPRIVLDAAAAPPIAGDGSDVSSGARDAGPGSGAGGNGYGLGAGGQGAGTGGGGGTKVAKVAGDIVSARDYPRSTRSLRLGSSVTVSLTVGIDGRAKNCRIVRASRDPEADWITCRLAIARFRFDPARDATGNAVESNYGWQQRWFAPNAD